MADRHYIADEEELAEDGTRVVADLGGVEVAVFQIEGEYHALANYCIHAAGPLCEGELTGEFTVDPEDLEWNYEGKYNVACPWHGWMFDIRTGRNIDDEHYQIPTYETEVEDGEVYVVT